MKSYHLHDRNLILIQSASLPEQQKAGQPCAAKARKAVYQQDKTLTYPQRTLLPRPSPRRVSRSGARGEVVARVSCRWVCPRPAAVAAAADQASCQSSLSLKHQARHINGMRSAPGQILTPQANKREEKFYFCINWAIPLSPDSSQAHFYTQDFKLCLTENLSNPCWSDRVNFQAKIKVSKILLLFIFSLKGAFQVKQVDFIWRTPRWSEHHLTGPKTINPVLPKSDILCCSDSWTPWSWRCFPP